MPEPLRLDPAATPAGAALTRDAQMPRTAMRARVPLTPRQLRNAGRSRTTQDSSDGQGL